MRSGVYTITNTVDGKIYVGYSKNMVRRFSGHRSYLNNNKHPNVHLQYAFNKYGADCFRFEVLDYCEEEYMPSFENYWVNMLLTNDSQYGYNIMPTSPNSYPTIHSEETRRKMSLLQKGRSAGEKNPMFGRRGELAPAFGREFSIIERQAISKRMLGVNNPMFGREFTEEHKRKLSESHSMGKHHRAKKVICGVTGEEWECAHLAAIELNIPYSTLRAMLNGFRKNKTNLKYAA